MHIPKEMSQSEKATHAVMSPTRWHSGKGKAMKSIKRSAVGGQGEVNRQSMEDFQGSEKLYVVL